MLALNFGDWVYWEALNPPLFLGAQKVTFDGPNLRILVNDGETSINFKEDIYSAWKEWVKHPNHVNALYPPALRVVGGDPLPGDRLLGTTFFLQNGWRIRTWEGSHELSVNGNAFTEEGDSLFVDTILPWTIRINLNTSTLVETVVPQSNITNEDLQTIATNVWNFDAIPGETVLEKLINIPTDVWDEIIDGAKSQTAREKLKAIATKTQDLALN